MSVSDLKSAFPIAGFESDSTLPKNKEIELAQLAKDANLSSDDIQFLKEQYLKNHPNNQVEASKWKVSVAKKAVKAALPVIKKLAKKAGVKFGQKQLGKIINVITGVEDNVQGRLEKAFRTMGFSKKQAAIIARAIMFVLF